MFLSCTPQALGELPVEDIDLLITPSSFHERKASQIQAIARQVTKEYGGELLCDEEVLLSFSGTTRYR